MSAYRGHHYAGPNNHFCKFVVVVVVVVVVVAVCKFVVCVSGT